jgi:hypothetical protein
VEGEREGPRRAEAVEAGDGGVVDEGVVDGGAGSAAKTTRHVVQDG